MAQTIPKEELIKAGFFAKDTRPVVDAKVVSTDDRVDALGRSIYDSDVTETRQVPFHIQVTMLLRREWRNIVRNKRALAARFIFSGVMSLLTGVIFWRIGDRPLDGKDAFPVSTIHLLLGIRLSQLN